MIIDDIEKVSVFNDYSDHKNIRSWMVIPPLLYREDVIGLITLDSHMSNGFSRSMLDIGIAFASQAAIAIKKMPDFLKNSVIPNVN